MQLFSFGHPCEHQLRRTCIGGTSCPLNGYPDNWCCSFIKGKINFKRDKPCEGPRCRWGFSHPSQSQFDAVTQVLNESRTIAVKIDDAEDKEILSFTIENSHIVDTVQCTLHMLRHTPSNCAMRVGQLLAYAALRAGCAKVFVQLLKTLKKPLDGYLLGAHDYLTSGSLPTVLAVSTGSNTNATNNTQGKSAGKKGGSSDKKEDVSEELKNDVVDLMNAALSSGGQLVNREDQHTLQAVFIQALRSYPKSNKKRQEMLELAVAKFGSRPGPKNVTLATAVAGNTTVNNANNTNTNVNNNSANSNNNSTSHIIAATTTAGAAAYSLPHAGATTAAAVVAGNIATTTSNATATAAATANVTANTSTQAAAAAATTAAATLASAPVSGSGLVVCGGHSSRAPELLGDVASNLQMSSNSAAGGLARRQVAVGGTQAPLAIGARQKDSCSATHVKQQQQQQQQAQPHVVGISRLAQQSRHVPPRHYEPIRTDKPLPNVALFGGLFGLTSQSASWALLGFATCHKPTVSTQNTAAGAAASLGISSASSLELANEADSKALRFLPSSTPNYHMFASVDGLSADQQLLKTIYDEVSL